MSETQTYQRMADWLEEAWLSRYLDRRLSEAETEWFEAYALDKPEILALMDADSSLRDGMHLLQEAPAAGRPPAAEATKVLPLPRDRGARARQPWSRWAAAACVFLGIGWVIGQTARQQPLQLIASPTRVFYDTTRSELTEPVVFRGDAATPWTLIEIGLGSTEYRAELWLDGEFAGSLQASDEGVASVLVHQARLNETYQPVIRLMNAEGEEIRLLEISISTGEKQ